MASFSLILNTTSLGRLTSFKLESLSKSYATAGIPDLVTLPQLWTWVLAGSTGAQTDSTLVSSHFTSVMTGDDLLRKFWDVEEKVVVNCTLTMEERCALEYFNSNHSKDNDERFVVPLPKCSMEAKLSESRTQAVHQFLSFERSIHSKGVFPEVQKVVHEYFDQQHAERVPSKDLENSPDKVFYQPIHIVYKESSTTPLIRAVFDASANSSSGLSLNSTLMIGTTVHPFLFDVLI